MGRLSFLEEPFQVSIREYTKTETGFESSLRILEEGQVAELFEIVVDTDKMGFTIKLLKDINHEYEISYITDINASLGDTLSNTYTYNFKGEGENSEAGGETSTQEVTYQFVSGAGYLRTYKLKLTKKDGSTPLKDVEFGLYNKDGSILMKAATSNDAGVIDFGKIKWGTYVLKEIQPPAGYTKFFKVAETDEFVAEYEFTTTGEVEQIHINVLNEKPSKIIIDKHAKDKPSEKLEGASFEIRQGGEGGTLVNTITTNLNGKAESVPLPPGRYTLIETTAPDGYAKGVNTDVEIVSGQDSNLSIANELLHQAVKLTKQDEGDGNLKLEGVEFTLHHREGGGQVMVNAEGQELGELKTNVKGEIVVNNLAPGRYYFKEISRAKYYLTPGDPKTTDFEIGENQTVTKEVTKTNVRGKGSIQIEKVDSADAAVKLEGVEFTLSNEDGSFVRIQSTNSDGMITFEDIPYDRYRVMETKALENYVSNTEPIVVVLDDAQDQAIKSITVENHKKDHSVILTKYNLGKYLKLKGASFELRKKREVATGYEVITRYNPDQLSTDANGIIHLKDLEVGKYQLVETKAPTGYVNDSTPVEFEITENQTTPTRVEKTNRLIPDPGPGPTRNGKLLVEKTVSGKGADQKKEFIFTIDFDSNDQYYFYDGRGRADGVIFNGETVKLAHGQSIVIRGIPEGTRYTVTEADYSKDGYLMTQSGSRGAIVEEETSRASFTNTKASEDPEDPKDPDPEDPEPQDPEAEDPTDPDPENPEDPEGPEPQEPPVYEEAQVPDPSDPNSPDTIIIVDEGGVPIGKYTKEEQEDGSFIYVDEDGVPFGKPEFPKDPKDTKNPSEPNEALDSSVPKTGDTTPVIPLMILFVVSLLGAIGLTILKKKRFN